jgi:hypothetical protein
MVFHRACQMKMRRGLQKTLPRRWEHVTVENATYPKPSLREVKARRASGLEGKVYACWIGAAITRATMSPPVVYRNRTHSGRPAFM